MSLIKIAASSKMEFFKRLAKLKKSNNYPLGSADALKELHHTATQAIANKVKSGSSSPIRGAFVSAKDEVKDFYGNKASVDTFKKTMKGGK